MSYAVSLLSRLNLLPSHTEVRINHRSGTGLPFFPPEITTFGFLSWVGIPQKQQRYNTKLMPQKLRFLDVRLAAFCMMSLSILDQKAP